MKINTIKLILLTTFFLSNVVSGQELKISYGGERDNGGILFSLSRLDADGNVIIKTDPIFSKARIVKDSLRQNIVASIEIIGHQSNKSIEFIDKLWLCLNDSLRVVFHYPIGTVEACGLKDGVSLFSYDRNFDIVGAVDSIGNIIMQPKYEYIIKNGVFLNGINRIIDDSSAVVMQCCVFKQGDTEPDYTYDIILDETVPIFLTIHNEYSSLIDVKSFLEMLQDIEYNRDTQLYLWGIHQMLNMDFSNALLSFKKIENVASFVGLEDNMRQCKNISNIL